MTQTIPKLVTLEEFVKWKPEGGRDEIHDGVIFEMPQLFIKINEYRSHQV